MQELERYPYVHSDLPTVMLLLVQEIENSADSFSELANGKYRWCILDFEKINAPSHVVQAHSQVMLAR